MPAIRQHLTPLCTLPSASVLKPVLGKLDFWDAFSRFFHGCKDQPQRVVVTSAALIKKCCNLSWFSIAIMPRIIENIVNYYPKDSWTYFKF